MGRSLKKDQSGIFMDHHTNTKIFRSNTNESPEQDGPKNRTTNNSPELSELRDYSPEHDKPKHNTTNNSPELERPPRQFFNQG
jgi:hypothetical protein